MNNILSEKYRIIKPLGEGGTSLVYLGKDMNSGELVTIKRLKKNAGQSARESFDNEAEMLLKVQEDGFPRLLDRGNGVMVLSFTKGKTLQEILLSKGKLKEKEMLRIAKELSVLMRKLHEKDEPVIYRDLKPANIVLDDDGRVNLIDFGAVRAYKTDGSVDTTNLGTMGFAAPEQYGSLGQTNVQTDIYCFGMTLLQMVSGMDLRDSDRIASFKENGLKGVSPSATRLIYKCIKADRRERFKSFAEIERALLQIPVKKTIGRAVTMIKVTAASTLIALGVSTAFLHYVEIRDFAKENFDQKTPAVLIRLGYAREKLDMFFDEIIKEKE